MSEFEKNIHAIKEDVRHRFWTREEIEQIHFQESLKNSQKLNEVFTKMLSTDFVDSMKETINQRLELFDNIIQNEQHALQNATHHYDQVLKNSEKVMGERERNLEAYENIAFRMQDFTSQLQKSNHSLAIIQNELLQKEQNLEKLSYNLEKNISELNTTLNNLNPQNIKELYKGVQQNIEIMRSESAKIGYSFNKHLNDFDEQYADKLRLSLELIDRESAKIIRQIAKLKDLDNHV
jgi:dsDNA-specific endonuclease/ATPase MutS2